jgi:hypothetical protein
MSATRTNTIFRILAMDDGAKNQLLLAIVDELYLDNETGALDEGKEWDQGTIERIAALVDRAELNPINNALPFGEQSSALVSHARDRSS